MGQFPDGRRAAESTRRSSLTSEHYSEFCVPRYNRVGSKAMKKLLLLLAAVSAAIAFQGAKNPDAARWEQRAKGITIVRDDWGIAHVTGKTDADAVFGMIY